MKQYSVIAIFLAVALLAGCSNANAQSLGTDSEPKTRTELPASTASKEDCYLCGSNRPAIWKFYEKPGSIIVLCLNTWNIGDTRLYEYDDDGNTIENPGHSSITMDSHGEGECRWSFWSDPDRNNCRIELRYGENSVLDPDKLVTQLCQDCLDNVGEAIWPIGIKDDWTYHCDVLVDMDTGDIYPISSDILHCYIGDIWLHVDHDKENNQDTVHLVYNPK